METASPKITDYQPNDLLIRLIGIPVLSILIVFILQALKVGSPAFGFTDKLVMSLTNTLLLWEGNRWLFVLSRWRWPHYSQTRRRLFYQSAASLVYTFLVAGIIDNVICTFVLGIPKDAPSPIGFFTALVPTLCVTMAYESVHFFESMKQHIQQTEALARAQVQSQLDVLKNQLDPHFLFNSLNTLAALIDETNEPAQTYLDHLADVYRYVLVSREKNTVTVDEEMRFLDAYLYLHKARFRDNLMVEKQLSAGVGRRHVAPLSLQLLVENAIKHNVVSRDKPLTIKIMEEPDGYLAVENNLQAKTTSLEQSTKVGLQNIVERYRLLTAQPVEVHRSPDRFEVRLPLLAG
jgi:two-component sensor histidine kinase